MSATKIYDIDITNVSSTLLLTLYSHAMESQSKNPILKDPEAEAIAKRVNSYLEQSPNKMMNKLAKGKLRKDLIVHIAVRAKQYDGYAKAFLADNPDGVIVSLGCGLDTRFSRIDNGDVLFYDLDLPEVIEIKKNLVAENDRYKFIGCSVLDYSWMDEIETLNKPVLFIAEGLLMYLPQKEVQALVVEMDHRFPNSELVCEVVHVKYTKGFYGKVTDFKFQKELHLGEGITYGFGLNYSEEMEEWAEGIKFIDEWCYFDSTEKKIGWMRMLGRFKTFRNTQWTVRYRLE